EIGGQNFVFHMDEFQGFFRDGLGNGGYTGHVIANITNLVERQSVLVMTNWKDAERRWSIIACHDSDHAIQSERSACIDVLDAGVREGRMQDLSHQHPGQAEIVSVFADPGGLLRRVDDRDRLADYRKVFAHSWGK